jgi:hypothetical protein
VILIFACLLPSVIQAATPGPSTPGSSTPRRGYPPRQPKNFTSRGTPRHTGTAPTPPPPQHLPPFRPRDPLPAVNYDDPDSFIASFKYLSKGILSQRQLLKPVRFVRGSGIGDLKVDLEIKEKIQVADDSMCAEESTTSIVVEEASRIVPSDSGPSRHFTGLASPPSPSARIVDKMETQNEMEVDESNTSIVIERGPDSEPRLSSPERAEIAVPQTAPTISPSPPASIIEHVDREPLATAPSGDLSLDEPEHVVPDGQLFIVDSVGARATASSGDLSLDEPVPNEQLFVIDSIGHRGDPVSVESSFSGPALGESESDSDEEDQVVYIPPSSSTPAEPSATVKPYRRVITENSLAEEHISLGDTQGRQNGRSNGQKLSSSAKRRAKREGRARRKAASRSSHGAAPLGDENGDDSQWLIEPRDPGPDIGWGDDAATAPSPSRRYKDNGDLDALSDYIQNVMRTSSSDEEGEADGMAAEAALESFVSSMSAPHMTIDDLGDERRLAEAEAEMQREFGGWTTEEYASSSGDEAIDIEERAELGESSSDDDSEEHDSEDDEDDMFSGKMSWADANDAYIDGIQVCLFLSSTLQCRRLTRWCPAHP